MGEPPSKRQIILSDVEDSSDDETEIRRGKTSDIPTCQQSTELERDNVEENDTERRKEDFKESYPPVFVIPTNIEEAVSLAISVISNQIQQGTWWSQFHPNDSLENETNAKKNLPVDYLNAFVQVLRHFGLDVIIPYMVSQGAYVGRRVLLASCMMLREVLIVNAEGVFYPKALNNLNGISEDERLFQDSIVVTALILSALQQLDDAEKSSLGKSHISSSGRNEMPQDSRNCNDRSPKIPSLCEDFCSLLSDYHNRSGLFSTSEDSYATSDGLGTASSFDSNASGRKIVKDTSCDLLPRLDCRYQGVLPNGQVMSPVECKAWRVSFNICRQQHFLTMQKKTPNTARNRAEQHIRQMIPPEPNVVSMYVVEKDWFKKKSL